MRLTLLLCALTLLLGAAQAEAATVTVKPFSIFSKFGDTNLGSDVRVVAGPGERNLMTMSADAAAFAIADDGTPIVAGEGCVQETPAQVRCPRRGIPGMSDSTVVDLGDGDDTLRVAGVPGVTAFLGDGDDHAAFDRGTNQVHGGAGDDVLTGGSGRDLLSGDAGRDVVNGGAGDDLLDGGADREPDTLDGGPGADIVAASAAAGPRVRTTDLAAGTAFGDRVSSIERVWGNRLDDVLNGSAGPDLLEGHGSRTGDRLDGRGGDDVLLGSGPGRDRLVGGPGDDTLEVAAGGRADGGPGDDLIFGDRDLAVTCGPGRDTVADVTSVLPTDCERAEVSYLATFERPRLSGRTVRVEARRRGPQCRLALRVETSDGMPLSAWVGGGLRPRATTVRTLRLRRAPAGLSVIALGVKPAGCRRGRDAAHATTLRFAVR